MVHDVNVWGYYYQWVSHNIKMQPYVDILLLWTEKIFYSQIFTNNVLISHFHTLLLHKKLKKIFTLETTFLQIKIRLWKKKRKKKKKETILFSIFQLLEPQIVLFFNITLQYHVDDNDIIMNVWMASKFLPKMIHKRKVYCNEMRCQVDKH